MNVRKIYFDVHGDYRNLKIAENRWGENNKADIALFY